MQRFTQQELAYLESLVRAAGHEDFKSLHAKVTMMYEENKFSYEPLLTLATELAMQKHVKENAQKHGTRDYTEHLRDVTHVLSAFGFRPESGVRAQKLHIAGWLHDIVEDTDVSIGEIYRTFGDDIAEIVRAVTNPKELVRDEKTGEMRKRVRAEKHAISYPIIANNPDATILKLADRIANVEASIMSMSGEERPIIRMYLKEHKSFRKMIYREGTDAEPLWNHLDKLLSDANYAYNAVRSKILADEDGIYVRPHDILRYETLIKDFGL